MRIDPIMFGRFNNVLEGTSTDELEEIGVYNRVGLGGILGFGYRIDQSISLGLGLTMYPKMGRYDGAPWEFSDAVGVGIASEIGFLYRNSDRSFVYDSRIAWGNETFDVVDIENNILMEEVQIPIYLENTLTFARNEKRTFFIIKQLNDVSVDRVYYFGRILPAAEHFFSDSFSLRAGIEGSFAQLNDSSQFGYGALGGVTFRIIPWGMDIDFNISYRLRPSRMVEECLYTDILTLLTVSFNDVWISRE